MQKRYTSKNLELLQSQFRDLKTIKAYPKRFAIILAEETGFSENSIRETMLGRKSKIEVKERVVEALEADLGINKSIPKKHDYSKLGIKELMEKRLLPNGYSVTIGEILGLSEKTIRAFVINQLNGQSYNSNGERILIEIQKLAGYNKELELIHRIEAIKKRVQPQN